MRRIHLFSCATMAIAVACNQGYAQASPQASSQPQGAPVAADLPGGPPQAEARQEAPQETVSSASEASGVSQVRIVRLSEARGEVRLDRNTGAKFEQAFVNIPIVAGERLQTLNGLAEVEFEDNSTLRLTSNTLVEFPVLGRDAAGTVSQVKLVSGSAYMSMAGGKAASVYTLNVGSRTITLPPSSHIRVDMSGAAATVAVLGGSVSIANGPDGAGGTLLVPKKKSVTLDLNSTATPVLAAYKATDTPLDKWDKNSASYHQVRASSSFAGTSPYAYGLNDLSYYGSFVNYGGCGSLWRPYLVSSAWDPYQSGVWTLYPGAGYSWVSLYPWGWTPYHSGSWQYCGGLGGAGGGGWGWRPGTASSWTALRNHPLTRTLRGGPLQPLPPLPRPGSGTLVPINVKALPRSEAGADGRFTFRNDSAGLGVPRGSFGNLGKVSHTVAERGFATTAVSERAAQRGMIAVSPGNAGARPGGSAMSGVARPSGGAGPVGMSAGPVGGGGMRGASSSAGPSGGAAPSGGGGGSHH